MNTYRHVIIMLTDITIFIMVTNVSVAAMIKIHGSTFSADIFLHIKNLHVSYVQIFC